MAMSPRKMMAMGKNGEKKTKSAVKLRGGGMVKKMNAGGSVKKSPRPQTRGPQTLDSRPPAADWRVLAGTGGY